MTVLIRFCSVAGELLVEDVDAVKSWYEHLDPVRGEGLQDLPEALA